jgi:hypothetical protein
LTTANEILEVVWISVNIVWLQTQIAVKFIFILLLVPLVSIAQHQERTVFLYNTLFGGLSSGIGATINKPRDKNWKAAFVRGFWQGSIGGTVNYSSKKTLHLVYKKQNVAFALPAKLLNAAGNSIIENAARSEPFLQNWSIDYGPVRFDFSLNGKRKFTARFLPMSLYAIINGAKDSKLDWKTSFWSGDIVFAYSKGYFFTRRGVNMLGGSTGRGFIYTATQSDSVVYYTIAHELVHEFQYKEYQVFNAWLKPFEQKVKSQTFQTLFSKYIYFDVPYFFAAYRLEGSHQYPNNTKNFFEFEADRFASNSFVK